MSNEDDAKGPRRLRLPTALAVAFVGTSASVAMTFAGCDVSTPPEPIDAGVLSATERDAGLGSDAAIDAAPQMVDAAPAVADAYVPPDAPHT